MSDARRILVVGPSWVGDMVMAQSLFMAIKARLPEAFIAVLAPAWTAPLLDRMPQVDEALGADFRHGHLGIGERLQQGRALRGYRFDQAMVLPRSIKSALVPWLARIPRRTGYRGEMRYGLINDIRPLDKQRLPMTVQRFVFLASSPGAAPAVEYPRPRLRVEPASLENSLRELALARPGKPLLALCPGAEYGPAKRWPARHFSTLARRARQAGFAVWLFGSDKDRETTAAIGVDAGPACVDLAGRTNLGQAIDLMSLASVVVSNDSGLMHVAAALERPLVALYGSSSPSFTPPLSPGAKIMTLDLECSPCFRRECPLGHLACLENLDPDQVLEAVRQQAAGAGPRHVELA